MHEYQAALGGRKFAQIGQSSRLAWMVTLTDSIADIDRRLATVDEELLPPVIVHGRRVRDRNGARMRLAPSPELEFPMIYNFLQYVPYHRNAFLGERNSWIQPMSISLFHRPGLSV